MNIRIILLYVFLNNSMDQNKSSFLKQLYLPLNGIDFSKPSEVKPRRRKINGLFLRGPIPWDWLTVASEQPGKALHVGLVLWFLQGLKKNYTVPLSQDKLRKIGVTRSSAYRGLASLEKAGLVSVVRHIGRNSIVTILELAINRESK